MITVCVCETGSSIVQAASEAFSVTTAHYSAEYKRQCCAYSRLNEKIATLNEEMKCLEAIDKQRLAEPAIRA